MTIEYKGIRRKTTDVLDDYGQAHYAQNVRFKRMGEIGRRAGIGKSNMAQLAGPVQFMIGGWSNEPFIVNGTGGTVTGNGNPLAYFVGLAFAIPGGATGQPSAPIILSVNATPPDPQAYVAGLVTFAPVIIYDGLSGPLVYSWPTFLAEAGPGIAFATGAVDQQTCEYDFNIGATAGNYLSTLDVTAGPFIAHGQIDFTVT